MRVDVLDPTGSVASPVDLNGVTRKFKANSPNLPVDRIAEVAMSMEKHTARELVDLLATARQHAVA
jgi:hypothetical protein